MYTQLIYFIIVLLLFSLQPPSNPRVKAGPVDLSYILVLFFLFAAFCRTSFRGIVHQASRSAFPSTISFSYYRLLARLNIMAIAWLFLYLYVFNFRLYLRVIPGFEKSSTIAGLTGLLIYMIHLCVIWYYSHPAYQVMHDSRASRSSYVRAQFSFAAVILAPWLLISSVTDLLQLVKTPAFIASETGQFLVVLMALFAFVLFGPWLMVRLWRCEPLAPDYVNVELQQYCKEHNFRVGGFLLWPLFGGEMITAAIVGILPGLRYILMTSGLLNLLDLSELKAVVAHEMGHVRKKHLLLFIGLFMFFIFVVYGISDMLMLLALSNRTILNWALSPVEGPYLVSLLSSIPLIILMVLFFRFVFGFFLRNSERQADLFALELLGTPYPLVSSFEKIARHSGKIADLPNWHHYSIRQRIDFLFAAFENRDLIRKHNIKLYGSALAFTALSGLLLFAGVGTDRSALAKGWRTEIQLGILEREIAKNPEDVELQAVYGGVLFETARYSEAESVLSAALTLDPNNATLLNNLAWLYATTPEPFRNPSEALALAYRAAELKPEPHVLDTLAEALYINGRYEEALAAINAAIAKGGRDRDHFLKQREKFERALRGRV